jgi:microcystin-dependent protein
MADPFVAEIRIFPFNFAPKGWAFCAGQLMPISQNTALFSLLGTTYGGDGKSTFALPNMQGNVPIHTGGSQPGPGLSVYDLGEQSGTETVTLLTTEMPVHTHNVQGLNGPPPANAGTPDPSVTLARSSGSTAYIAPASPVIMAPQTFSVAGSSLPHNNMMIYLTLNFCIALQGIFPARP